MGDRTWKIIYTLLCLALLIFTACQFSRLPLVPTTGWDYRAYVSGIQALDHMQNPYILKNLFPYQSFGTHLKFAYPPHTLYFFWFLDLFFVFHYMSIYYTILLVLLIISGYLIATLDQEPHYLFLTTLLLTGFSSTFWNFLTGNLDICFLFLFSIIFTFLAQEKYWQSSVVMGISAAVSLFTAPFVILYLVIKRPVLDRLALIFTSIGIVALLFIVSYLINPLYLLSYFDMMHGSNSPFIESGGWNEPTPYLLFKDVLLGISSGSVIPAIVVSCIYVGIILYATWKYCRKNYNDSLKTLSLVMLSTFMVLPRLMPYNFIVLIVPLYLLFKDSGYRTKSVVLATITILPFFIWYLTFLHVNYDNLPFLLGSYAQAYSLFLVFLVVVFADHMRSASIKEGNGGKNPME